MADQHTVRAYDKDLDLLERRIAEMGGLAEKMVIEAVDALASGDAALAQQVVETDPRLDALQREIEEQATLTIARRQPVANDLREIIGAIRVAGDLERVGDLAKNIARRALKIGLEGRVPHAIVGIKHMNEFATELMKDVLDAYAQRDVERALDVWERDVELDALEDLVFRDLLTHMMEDPRNITFCAHLLFCSKNIERIGDHATNIAETVVYLVTGSNLPTGRPHGPAGNGHRDRRDRSGQVNQARKDMVRHGAASAPRILIVEDESDLSLLLGYNLEAEGYVVENVERGDEAELRLAENAPDLVILDWMLPGVSGLEICRRLRARESTRTLPVIMVTARGEEAERVRGLSVGADDYVVKPFSVPELMARVRALLRRSRPERIAERLYAGRSRSRPGDAAGAARHARHPSRPDRVPAARISSGEARPGVLARATPGRRVGPGGGDRRTHGRRPCRAPAQGALPRPRARPHPNRARNRLRLRRNLRQTLTSQNSDSGNEGCGCRRRRQ